MCAGVVVTDGRDCGVSEIKISAALNVHNEETNLEACLETLGFADEIVVILDNCTDGSKEIAQAFNAKMEEGAWEFEGERRNRAIALASGDWIFEIDADERVPAELADEILSTVRQTQSDWHEIPVDNYIGDRLVRHGWGASYGKAAYPGLFKRDVKRWGRQRVHPRLEWSGNKGTMLTNRLVHFVDRDISDMVRRLDSYSTARARDLLEAGDIGSTANNVRRLFSRFIKCYVGRRGYREGGYGFLIALFAGLYPLLSHLKAKEELD